MQRGLNLLRWLALGLHAAGIAFIMLHHQPWRDEADTWVAALHMPLTDAVNYFRLSGHPPLWMLILLPFSRLGFPPETLQVIHLCIALASAWLIVFRCPLWLPLRLSFLVTVAAAYQYAVVSRGYALMILVLFAIASLHAKRMEKPVLYALLLALLWQTEVHAFGAASCLCLFFAYDVWQQRVSPAKFCRLLAIPSASALFMLIVMWPAPASLTHVAQFPIMPLNSLATIGASFMPEMPFVFAAGIVPLLLWIICLLKNPRGQALYIATLSWLLFLCVFIYSASHHMCLFAPLWLFALWLNAVDRPGIYATNSPLRWNGEFPAAVLFALQLPLTLSIYYNSVKTPFSGAKDMAEFIRHEHLDQGPIALTGCFSMVSVTYYLPDTTFWFAAQNRQSHYLLLGYPYDECYAMPMPRIMQNIAARYVKGVIVLTDSKPVPPPAPAHYQLKLLHESTGSAESYQLYRLLPDAH